MKLCPASRYASIIGIDAFSSQPNCSLPKFIAPKHSGDTRSPDRPRFLKPVDGILANSSDEFVEARVGPRPMPTIKSSESGEKSIVSAWSEVQPSRPAPPVI